jgi:hypothetical protein
VIQALNPPLAIVPNAPTGIERVTEFAYYREVKDERRPARSLGRWVDVWARLDAALKETA